MTQNQDRTGERPAPRVKLGPHHVRLPASRVARLGLGIALILLGLVGFLPVLGFWMIPLGVLVISYDIAAARWARRKTILWWNGRGGKKSKRRTKNRGSKGRRDEAAGA